MLMALTHGIPPDFRGGVHLFIPLYTIGSFPSSSGHVIAYQQESAGTGPIDLEIVPVTGATFAGHNGGPTNARLSFPTPTILLLI